MKQTIALLAATTALFTQVGCSNSSTHAAPVAAPDAHGQSAAKVSYNSGTTTFVVDSEGNYQIAQGAGQLWSDKLSSTEATQVKDAIRPFEGKGTQSLSLEACTGAASEETQALCQVVTSLNVKYAPAQAPTDACVTAAQTLEGLHHDVSHCSADSECAYVAPGYSVYEGNARGSVLLDSNTWFHALPVANGKLVQDNFGHLSDARAAVTASCGARHAGNAIAISSFDFAAPSCVANVCVSSSI